MKIIFACCRYIHDLFLCLDIIDRKIHIILLPNLSTLFLGQQCSDPEVGISTNEDPDTSLFCDARDIL